MIIKRKTHNKYDASDVVYNRGKSTEASVQSCIDDIYSRLNNIFKSIYPIGAIYMSSDPTNPGTLFGGEWIAWGEGRVPIGVGSNGVSAYTSEQTGGNEGYNHYHDAATSGGTAITVAQMPVHNHTLSCGGSAMAIDANVSNPVWKIALVLQLLHHLGLLAIVKTLEP